MTFSDQKQIIAYNENIYTIMWIQYAAYIKFNHKPGIGTVKCHTVLHYDSG